MKVLHQKIFGVQTNEMKIEGKVVDLIGLGGNMAVVKDDEGNIWAVDQRNITSAKEDK